MLAPRLILALIAVFPLSAQLLVDTYAGGAIRSGVPAQSVAFGNISGLVWDPSGNIVLCDTTYDVIRRVGTDGILVTIAGTGVTGYSGDGGPATSAQISSPISPQYDASGNLYFLDSGNFRIRRIDTKGMITTVAGDGEVTGPDGPGPATARSIAPAYFAVTPNGMIYLPDNNGNLLRVTPAGNLEFFVQIPFPTPGGLATDSTGNVYFFDQIIYYYPPQTLYRVTPSGEMSTYATYPISLNSKPGGFLTSDAAGNIYAFVNSQLFRYAPDGTSEVRPTPATLISSSPAAIDPSGKIAFSSGIIQTFSAQAGLTTVAGGNPQSAPDGTPLRDAWFVLPGSIAFGPSGDLYISEIRTCLIRKINAAGVLSTFAGTGTCSTSMVPSGNAKTNNLPYPSGLAIDSTNRVWVANASAGVVYSIAPDGTVSAPTGNGCGTPTLAIDSKDRVYVLACGSLNRILADGTLQQLFAPLYDRYSALGRDPSGNIYAGTPLDGTYRINDNGVGTLVPYTGQNGDSLAVDAKGNVWQNPAGTLEVYSPAGAARFGIQNGGSSGDGGPVVAADFSGATSLTFSPDGRLFFLQANRIRRIIGAGSSIAPVISQNGIVNATNYAGGPIAAGELISIFGTNFGATSLNVNSAENNALPSSILGTKVLFNGRPGAITAMTPTQINVFVPYEIGSISSADVQVQVDDVLSATVMMPVAATAPGFSSSILNQDGTVNTAANPAPRGSIVSFYGTGLGQMIPQLPDGALAIATPYSTPVNPPILTIGGQPATILYAGDAPGFPTGVFQINATIPTTINPGPASVSNQVTVFVK
ncbi:MAG TPA: hypothetical protein VNU44_01050 [Bryobacteraceae bacterium]|nr:hypothetical protein [Bryobacteraceae bacterium]